MPCSSSLRLKHDRHQKWFHPCTSCQNSFTTVHILHIKGQRTETKPGERPVCSGSGGAARRRRRGCGPVRFSRSGGGGGSVPFPPVHHPGLVDAQEAQPRPATAAAAAAEQAFRHEHSATRRVRVSYQVLMQHACLSLNARELSCIGEGAPHPIVHAVGFFYEKSFDDLPYPGLRVLMLSACHCLM